MDYMTQTRLAIIIFMAVALFFTGTVSAQSDTVNWVSVIKEKCDPCVEGQKTLFDISINNIGAGEFAVRSVSLIDTDGVIFATSSLDTIVPSNNTKSFTIDSIVPPASRGKTLYYKTCFVLSSGDRAAESCEPSVRMMILQDGVEVGIVIIYILLSVILIVMTAFFLLFLRRLDRGKR